MFEAIRHDVTFPLYIELNAIYVDDLVEAISRLMLTGGDRTGPINLGNHSEFTILDSPRR